MNREIRLNIPITKIDEEQRMVWGIATSEAIDSQGDIIDYEASKAAFGAWLGNIREMHQPIAVGKAIDIQYDDTAKQVMIGAKISESTDGENAWIKVKEGVLQGFSIGGAINRVKKEVSKVDGKDVPVTRIIDYSLAETSLVDNPANPEAMLVMVKSAGRGLQRVEHAATASEIKKEVKLPAWHHQFMLPIEKAQALYDKSMNKAGVAVLDGDARDASAASVATVLPTTPSKGGTVVPKKVVGADGKSITNKTKGAELKKGLWTAGFLLDLACNLNYYIENQQYEGQDVTDLQAALATIKAAIVDEITESDDLAGAVELAEKITSLKKGKNMAKETTTKATAVVGEEARDENAEVTVPTVAGVEEGTVETPAPEDDKEVIVPVKEEDTGAEVDEGDDAPKDDADGESSEEGAKAVTLGDLKKFANGLVEKLGDNSKEELKKALGEFTDKVSGSMTAIEDRLTKLEAQPAPRKGKASFVEVTKGEDADADKADDEVQEVLKRQDELMKNPNAGTPKERMEIVGKIRKFMSEGRKLELKK